MTPEDESPRLEGFRCATREEWRPLLRKRPKQKRCPVVVKLQCCKQQCCLGAWNVRSTNRGELDVVKPEVAREDTDILGIRELKWTRMGELNSDDHSIYYCGQESLRRNGVALIVNGSPKCSTRVQSQKRQNDFCSFPRQIIQHHSNSDLCPNQ